MSVFTPFLLYSFTASAALTYPRTELHQFRCRMLEDLKAEQPCHSKADQQIYYKARDHGAIAAPECMTRFRTVQSLIIGPTEHDYK